MVLIACLISTEVENRNEGDIHKDDSKHSKSSGCRQGRILTNTLLSLTALCQGSVTDKTALGLRHYHTFPANTEDGNWFAWMGKTRIFMKFGTWAGSLLPAEA